MLTPNDDFLHPPVNDDRYWTETVWFCANVPERKLALSFYMQFRTNMGIVCPSLWIWGPDAENVWEIPYQRTLWYEAMPKDIDVTNFKLASGFEIERLSPMDSYRLRYSDGDRVSVDLVYKGLSPAVPYGVANGYGHLDQYGRVTGEIVLDGETIAVDCFDMRDRTWSPRRETSQRARVGYAYGAASATDGFQVATKWDEASDEDRLMLGFFLTPQGNRLIKHGTREVARDAEGRPTEVILRLYDETGVEQVIRGVIENRFAQPSNPYLCWMCLVRWTMPSGAVAWGQDQDTWAPAKFRDLRRDLKLAAKSPA